MLLTEEGAKEKDCWQFVDDIERNAFGNDQHNVGRPYCSASGCMAWRWDEDTFKEYKYDSSARVSADHYKDRPQAKWKGYCGLAGKPE